MKNTAWKAIYGVLAFIGILSAVWGHESYLLTFIKPIWLALICFISTSVTFFIIKNHYSELYKTDKSYLPFAQSFCSIGMFITSAFLVTNFQLRLMELSNVTCTILEFGELGGRNHKPFAIIRKGGFTK